MKQIYWTLLIGILKMGEFHEAMLLLKFTGTLSMALAEGAPFENWDLHNHRALIRRMDRNPAEEPQGVIRSRALPISALGSWTQRFFHLGTKHHIMATHAEHICPWGQPSSSRDLSCVVKRPSYCLGPQVFDDSVWVSIVFTWPYLLCWDFMRASVLMGQTLSKSSDEVSRGLVEVWGPRKANPRMWCLILSRIGRCFGWGQHLISQFQVKEVILHDVGGMHPISWRLELNEKIGLLEQEEIPSRLLPGFFCPSGLQDLRVASPRTGTAPLDVPVLERAGLHCECGCASLHDHVSQFLLTNLFL